MEEAVPSGLCPPARIAGGGAGPEGLEAIPKFGNVASLCGLLTPGNVNLLEFEK